MKHQQELKESIANGANTDAVRFTESMLDSGVDPIDIVNGALLPGMTEIGDRFKDGDAFVPEMLLAARAMKECMARIEPLLLSAGHTPEHTAVIGTVKGDLHDIGKNLVAVMWKAVGIEVIDLGTSVPPEGFVAAVKEHQPDLVGLSALLTTTMPEMESTVAALRQAGFDSIPVLVGGAPITEAYSNQIGANGFGRDAVAAADLAQEVLSASSARRRNPA